MKYSALLITCLLVIDKGLAMNTLPGTAAQYVGTPIRTNDVIQEDDVIKEVDWTGPFCQVFKTEYLSHAINMLYSFSMLRCQKEAGKSLNGLIHKSERSSLNLLAKLCVDAQMDYDQCLSFISSMRKQCYTVPQMTLVIIGLKRFTIPEDLRQFISQIEKRPILSINDWNQYRYYPNLNASQCFYEFANLDWYDDQLTFQRIFNSFIELNKIADFNFFNKNCNCSDVYTLGVSYTSTHYWDQTSFEITMKHKYYTVCSSSEKLGQNSVRMLKIWRASSVIGAMRRSLQYDTLFNNLRKYSSVDWMQFSETREIDRSSRLIFLAENPWWENIAIPAFTAGFTPKEFKEFFTSNTYSSVWNWNCKAMIIKQLLLDPKYKKSELTIWHNSIATFLEYMRNLMTLVAEEMKPLVNPELSTVRANCDYVVWYLQKFQKSLYMSEELSAMEITGLINETVSNSLIVRPGGVPERITFLDLCFCLQAIVYIEESMLSEIEKSPRSTTTLSGNTQKIADRRTFRIAMLKPRNRFLCYRTRRQLVKNAVDIFYNTNMQY